jgi:hypothetical protein
MTLRPPDYTPLPEEYSRVTNPERFAPLHDRALALITRLQADYDVERRDGYGLDPELEVRPLVRETVTLAPRNAVGAPLAVAFTDFPGLAIRFGRLSVEWFPPCGCDACGGDADLEYDRLEWMVEQLAAGRFRESISKHKARFVFWSPDGRQTGRGWVFKSADRAKGDTNWQPWPRRASTV